MLTDATQRDVEYIARPQHEAMQLLQCGYRGGYDTGEQLLEFTG